MGAFSKIWQGAVIASMLAAPAVLAKVTIYMCGDSTMQDWNEGYYPKQGRARISITGSTRPRRRW